MLTTIFIILLIISQLLCFYIIALLNAKVAKFKELEIRQEQIMREMEESVSLYLVEIQEENDRLIKELSEGKVMGNVRKAEKWDMKTNEETTIDVNVNDVTTQLNNEEASIEQKVFVPKSIARNAYNKNKKHPNNNESKMIDQNNPNVESEVQLSFLQQVLKLHNEGKNIEEIAKQMNKGKTEIELLLKFNT